MSFLEIKALTKQYAARTVVSAIDLTLEKGEILSLLGPSGCGKTTILRMIAGLITPDSGYIRVENRVFYDNGRQLPTEERELGMVFQDLALWPHMTVAKNIGFGLRLRRQPAAFIAERVEELLMLVNLPGFGNRYPHQLLGGQQQRIAVARALATSPRIILLDEPLSSLDTGLRATMREELVQLFKRLKITAINVTHDQDEATVMSDRIMVLRDGRIQQMGRPTELYLEPENVFVASFIGQANFLQGHAISAADSHTDDTHTDGTTPMIHVKVLSTHGVETLLTERLFTSSVSPNIRAHLNDGVMLMCRPDNVRVHLCEPMPDVPNVLRGTVAHTSFVAGRWRTLFGVDGQAQPVLAYPSFSPQIDQRVWLELPPPDCRILPME